MKVEEARKMNDVSYRIKERYEIKVTLVKEIHAGDKIGEDTYYFIRDENGKEVELPKYPEHIPDFFVKCETKLRDEDRN